MADDAPRAIAGEDPRVLAFLDAIADAIAESILRDVELRSLNTKEKER
jgi:hypothetical protein